ncbi:hypothetical protein N7454_001021 [Penicillium verhagenii]|nr:hypothetical protein N7454_001021 [Penicillium verhagenii]
MARSDALQNFLQPLRIEVERLYRLSYRLFNTYRALAADSSEQFFPTATTRLPTGHEKGRYLAVYLGLFYLRVAFIDLLGEEQVEKHSHVRRTLVKAWPIQNRLRQDQADSYFPGLEIVLRRSFMMTWPTPRTMRRPRSQWASHSVSRSSNVPCSHYTLERNSMCTRAVLKAVVTVAARPAYGYGGGDSSGISCGIASGIRIGGFIFWP